MQKRYLKNMDKDIKNNCLIIGYENDRLLHKKQISVINVHWIAGHPPKFPLKCMVRLRHRQPLQKSKIINHKPARHGLVRGMAGGSKIIVQFLKPQRAVTPGQFAVFYSAKVETCLGGGVIK